jgi:hypothetical protein
MFNVLASAVTVQLDKERTMILDFNAFAMFRQATGEELPDVVADMFQRDAEGRLAFGENGAPVIKKPLTTIQVRAMVWAGCFHEDSKLTLQVVGRHLSQRNYQELIQACFKSLYGIEDDEPKDPTQAQAQLPLSDGTGTGSGVSAD